MATDGKPDFGILLLLAEQEFVRELRATAAARGFDDQGRSDGFVLRTLGAAPSTISALAERLDISKQGAAQIVDDMERRGYVERHPDPTDGRARLIRLSERGQAALAAARRFHQAYERRLRKTHGDAAIDAVRAVLTSMGGEDSSTDPHFRALMF
ncbi:MarR family winged helix-turn-helix transcriptional regulator [Kribbella sp. CA-293567]|uniref:MarR family winged helix-turn-helix transcriptional regulator n=1 Tax=Kribbella sp. CA-293567 TaxID=3002436 RepID=UPI0022DDDD43|nr:MarR family transcriptional regulator [Kribbella sp. CA-293567]WBQ07373.1 MarR family transcriptional regulator [Kribbella sp. CA-293567]